MEQVTPRHVASSPWSSSTQSATRASDKPCSSCAGARRRSRPTMRLRRSPARVERGRAGRGQDRPVALGRSLLQDARGGDGRRARRSHPSERRPREARERRPGRRHGAGDTRRHASRGGDPRPCGQARVGRGRTVAVRGDAGLDHAQTAALRRAADPPARSGRISARAPRSRIVVDSMRSAAPSAATAEARPRGCSSGRAPGEDDHRQQRQRCRGRAEHVDAEPARPDGVGEHQEHGRNEKRRDPEPCDVREPTEIVARLSLEPLALVERPVGELGADEQPGGERRRRDVERNVVDGELCRVQRPRRARTAPGPGRASRRRGSRPA